MREDIPGFTTDLPNGLTVSVQWHTIVQARRHPVNKDNILSVEMACYVTANTSHKRPTPWMTGSVWPELSGGHDTMSFIPVADVVQLIDDASRWDIDKLIDKLHDQIRAVKEDIAANDKRISSLKEGIAAITKRR